MADFPIKSPRKLIEVALPLDIINAASVRESYIYKGNPSSMHKWWAQRPLAAARAVIFAQLVNDPGYQQGGGFKYGKNKKDAAIERKRLFKIIEDLVLWENITNEEVLERARLEIRRSWQDLCELNKNHPQAAEMFNPNKLPALHDPFAGGGTIPLEAQRLGLEAYASDLNPVAVLINKAMIEIPPRFAGKPPICLLHNNRGLKKGELDLGREWPSASGMAEDVRHYGAWMHAEAKKRIGHLYPPVEITKEMANERPELKVLIGKKLKVIAWLWARTVKSPNPAFSHIDVPLASTFVLSSKPGKEAYVEPVIDNQGYKFTIKTGTPPLSAKEGTKLARGANFRCLMSNTAMTHDYVRGEFQAKRGSECLMAIVAESDIGRIYLSPTNEHEVIARSARPVWRPEQEMSQETSNLVSGRGYGVTHWQEIFTQRQLVALSTLSDLVTEVRKQVHRDAVNSGMSDEDAGVATGGTGARAYAEAISVYLAFAANKTAEYSCTSTVWYSKEDRPKGVFARHAIPMVWDFPEQNVLGEIGGSFLKSSEIVADSLMGLCPRLLGSVSQTDAATGGGRERPLVFISTDPPYYDNIGYADLSDFFYIWLRPSLRAVFPDIFATLAVPKAEELVATPYRHGGKLEAEEFFLRGMTQAMSHLGVASSPAAPVTIYYAFKQADGKDSNNVASTGWVTRSCNGGWITNYGDVADANRTCIKINRHRDKFPCFQYCTSLPQTLLRRTICFAARVHKRIERRTT